MARRFTRFAPVIAIVACTGVHPQVPNPATTAPLIGGADPALVAAIAKIPVIDHHAHPERVLGPGEKDRDWDQLTADDLEPFHLPVAFGDDAQWLRATRDAFPSYPFDDVTDARDPWISAARAERRRVNGDRDPAAVLDQLGIETMIANRVLPGARGLAAPRFRWVPYVDALMFPLDVTGLRAHNHDVSVLLVGLVDGAKRMLTESGLAALPPTFDAYLKTVVTATLERARAAGAIAVKLESAYARPLVFGNPPEADARRIYEAFARGGVPPDADYRSVQDFLARYLAREAGRLGLAVHVHVAWGPGRWFDSAATTPYALESLFDDPTLAATKFVIIHGGWPEVHQTSALLGKPNVWADFSWQTQIIYPRPLSATLREWLELWPDKVMFGTDAFGGAWDIMAAKALSTGRLALALALTGMLDDHEITRERALELAHMVLHDNAARLYGWLK